MKDKESVGDYIDFLLSEIIRLTRENNLLKEEVKKLMTTDFSIANIIAKENPLINKEK